MMLTKLFKSKKTEHKSCFFCGTSVPGNKAFTLQYRASDGTGSVIMCSSCSNDMEQIKTSMGAHNGN